MQASYSLMDSHLSPLVPRPSPLALAPPRQRWLWAGLAAFFLVLSFQYTVKVASNVQDHRSAVMRWREQILALADGTDIWDAFVYPNPPIMALLLTPLMHLPPVAASLLWFFLKAALTLVAIHWVFRMLETPARPFPPLGKLLVILLALRPIVGDLMHGNVNLFILFVVVAGLYSFYHQRDLSAGLFLALAIACKVTPALFVPYFLWKRAWRTLAGCSLGLVLFFWLVPGLFLGMNANARYLNSWLEKMVWPYVRTGQVTSEHNNQSLPGLVHRLASHSPSFSDDREVYVPLEYHNFVNLDAPVLGWFLKGCMVLFALVVMWSCRTTTATRAGWHLLAEFSVIMLGMLLFSERTWKHHCVTLLLPFAVLVYYLFACRPGKLKWYLLATLAAAILLMVSTGTGLGLNRFGKLAQVYGAYVWAYLLLLAALVVLLRRDPQPAPFGTLRLRVLLDQAGPEWRARDFSRPHAASATSPIE